MVERPRVAVLRVGHGEPVGDLRGARRPVDVERLLPAGDPALNARLAEVADVVGWKCVRKTAESASGGTSARISCSIEPGPAIDEEHAPAATIAVRGARALRIGDRSAGAAEDDVQVRRREQRAVRALYVLRDAPVDQAVDHLVAAAEQHETEHDGRVSIHERPPAWRWM